MEAGGGGGLLHSTFFTSGSAFFFFFCFIPDMCFCCIIHRLKGKHNLPRSVDSGCEYGKHMAPSQSHCAAALVCLVASSARDAQMGRVTRSDWLFAAAGAENLHSGEGKNAEKGHH